MNTAIDFPYRDILIALCAKRRISAYVVGGFLRDLRLGRCGTDVDLAVTKDAIKAAKAFAQRIKGAFVLLDDAHGSARVVKNVDGHVWTFDLTDLRGQNITEDLRLRDFTINTFCMQLSDGKDISPKTAAQDLKRGIVRMVAKRSFKDDPLRLMRAFSLSAQTGFKIHPDTATVIKAQSRLIIEPAMERTREELFKVWHSSRAYQILLNMEKAGLLARVLPHLEVMKGVKQGGYHHLDVWKHSLMVLNELEKLLEEVKKDGTIRSYLQEEIGGAHTREALLKFAAVLHDIGKPQTARKEKDRMTFHGHEHAGAAIVRLLAKHLKVTVRERYWLEDAVRWHLRPGYLSNFKQPSPKAVFRYLRDTKSEGAAIAMLAIADQRSTCGPKTTKAKTRHHESICRMLIARHFQETAKPVVVRLITGHDLIKGLKLKPSPLFAKILNQVEEERALGKITTKEQAMALAKTIYQKGSA